MAKPKKILVKNILFKRLKKLSSELKEILARAQPGEFPSLEALFLETNIQKVKEAQRIDSQNFRTWAKRKTN